MNARSFDVIIIGCGPAGISALLWASELGLRAVALEAENEAGGQLLRTFNRIENHLGAEAGDGREMRDLFLGQLKGRKADIRMGTKVKTIRTDLRQVVTNDGSALSYRALLIATGVRRRALGVPGETEFQGRGILQSGKNEAERAKGKSAVVVGGGDAAFENVLILSEFAEKVSLIHRRDEFTARKEFVDAVNEAPNTELLKNRVVTRITGNTEVESVIVRNIQDGRSTDLKSEIIVIRIGVVPNSEIVRGICETDERGYIKVDSNGLTTAKHIFAAGDVANPNSPTISSAVGMSSTAVKTIRQTL